jgi:glutaredoxin
VDVRGAARPASDRHVVVYGTGWCPDVRRSRALLDSLGVPYRYVDVEEDAQAAELVRRLQGGHRRVPTVVRSDGEHLVEPTDPDLQAWLDAGTA